MAFQQFLAPVYYWKTVGKTINYYLVHYWKTVEKSSIILQAGV
jgi:hypothetical protein